MIHSGFYRTIATGLKLTISNNAAAKPAAS
jgi:hypothetical protein